MRLFVAVDPGERLRGQVEELIAKARRHAPDARWVRSEQAHLTLAFLGQVDDSRLPAVIEAVEKAAGAHPAFRLRVAGSGTFGGKARPRVLWLGLSAPGIFPVQASVEAALRDLGFELEERAFAPHLTLARARDPHGDAGLRAAAEKLAEVDLGAVAIRGLEVMQSHLSAKGSRYEVRALAPLGRNRA